MPNSEKPAYFLSDLHLGCKDRHSIPNRVQRVIELLHSWKGKASHVVLVGDVFEFWMEYRRVIPKAHFDFLRALADLVDSGVQVHYLCGNHDFNLGTFFSHQIGIHTCRILELNLQGRRVLFHHGDGLSASDWGYRVLRRLMIHPVNNWLFKLLHPDWGMALARWVGQSSRSYGKGQEPKTEEYLHAGERLLKEHDAEIFVFGHIHVGFVIERPTGVLVNCGEWLHRMTYVVMEQGRCRFVEVES